MSYWNPSLIKILLDKGGRLGILEHQYRLLSYPSPTSPLFNSTSSPPTSPPTPPHRSSYASPPSTQDKFQRAFDLAVMKRQWKEALELFEDILRSSTKSELSYCLHWNIGQCAIQCWKQEVGSGGTRTGSLVRRTSRESATGTTGLGSEGRASEGRTNGERRGSEGSRSEGKSSGERRGSEGSRSEGRGSRGRQGRASGGRGSEGAGEWVKKADEQFTNCLALLKNKIGSEKVASKSVRLLEVMEKKLQLQFMKGKEDSEETLRVCLSPLPLLAPCLSLFSHFFTSNPVLPLSQLKVQILDLVTKYAPYLKGFNDILLEIFPMPASMHKKHGSKEGLEGEGEGGDVEGDEPLEIMEVYAFERFLQTRDQQKNDELALVYK
jgi:hypothetical protein